MEVNLTSGVTAGSLLDHMNSSSGLPSLNATSLNGTIGGPARPPLTQEEVRNSILVFYIVLVRQEDSGFHACGLAGGDKFLRMGGNVQQSIVWTSTVCSLCCWELKEVYLLGKSTILGATSWQLWWGCGWYHPLSRLSWGFTVFWLCGAFIVLSLDTTSTSATLALSTRTFLTGYDDREVVVFGGATLVVVVVLLLGVVVTRSI